MITFRPAVRQDTPLIIGLAGPTKSGKTLSALRLATGLAGGKSIIMINAEGARGHQYADKFRYLTYDLIPPFRPTAYTEAVEAAAKEHPGCIIIDSGSHMHDGPGGILEWHEEILDEMCGADQAKRMRNNFTAWIKPKAAENEFIYTLLSLSCPVILCLRAKEKLRIVPGKQPVDLGWQPIVGERVAFETMFTLILPPHSRGVPDLEISDMREPFDTLIPAGRQIDEKLGQRLAEWAKGEKREAPATSHQAPQVDRETGDPPPADEEARATWTATELAKQMKAAGVIMNDIAEVVGYPIERNAGDVEDAVNDWLARNEGAPLSGLIEAAKPYRERRLATKVTEPAKVGTLPFEDEGRQQ